jgi:hypothetical protein
VRSLSIQMAEAWVVQQCTGNSGRVDTISTFSVGLVGAASALWPVTGGAPTVRQWLVVAAWSLRPVSDRRLVLLYPSGFKIFTSSPWTNSLPQITLRVMSGSSLPAMPETTPPASRIMICPAAMSQG